MNKRQDGIYPVSNIATVTVLGFSNGIWCREMQTKTKVKPRFWTMRQATKPNDSSTNINLNYIRKKLVTCSMGKLTLSLSVLNNSYLYYIIFCIELFLEKPIEVKVREGLTFWLFVLNI